jgi:hypothetical protein
MIPKTHIILGFLATIIIYLVTPISQLEALIIFLSSFLIDVDHYLIYAITKKDTSLKNAKAYFHRRKKKWFSLTTKEQATYKRYIYFLHGIEAWIIIYILSLYHPLAIFILYGFTIHMILDYIEFIQFKQPIIAKFSQLWVYETNKKKEHLTGY